MSKPESLWALGCRGSRPWPWRKGPRRRVGWRGLCSSGGGAGAAAPGYREEVGGGDQGLGRAPEEGRGGWGRQGERAILGCWWGQSPQEGPDVGRKGLDFSLQALESHRRFQGIAAPWAEGPEASREGPGLQEEGSQTDGGTGDARKRTSPWGGHTSAHAQKKLPGLRSMRERECAVSKPMV